MKKKDSLAWHIAKTRARRRYVCSVPIALSGEMIESAYGETEETENAE